MRFLDLILPSVASSSGPWLLVGTVCIVAAVIVGVVLLLFETFPSREKQETGGEEASPSDGL